MHRAPWWPLSWMANSLLVLGLGDTPSEIWAYTSPAAHGRAGGSSAEADTTVAITATPVNATVVSARHIFGFFMAVSSKSLCVLRFEETATDTKRMLTSC